MTLEEMTLLKEVLDVVIAIEKRLKQQDNFLSIMRNDIAEIKGFVGFKDASETTIAGGNVTNIRSGIPDNIALYYYEEGAGYVSIDEYESEHIEEFAHEVQEAPPTKRYHAIKDIVAGMANIEMFGEIIRIFPVNSFTYKDGKPGRVMNVNLDDETGVIKLCLWNDQIDEFARYRVGDWIEVIAEECKWDKSKVPKLQLLLGKSGSIRAKGQEALS